MYLLLLIFIQNLPLSKFTNPTIFQLLLTQTPTTQIFSNSFQTSSKYFQTQYQQKIQTPKLQTDFKPDSPFQTYCLSLNRFRQLRKETLAGVTENNFWFKQMFINRIFWREVLKRI